MRTPKLLITFFLLVMTILFAEQWRVKNSDLQEARWIASLSEEVEFNEQTWRSRQYANIGFTDQYLHYQQPLSGSADSEHYLTISPVYLDKVAVTFISRDGAVIDEVIKGDKFGDLSLSYIYDFGQFVFNVPANAVSAHVLISSTSSVNATVNFFNKRELSINILKRQLIKIGFFMFFCFAAIIGVLAWLALGSNRYRWYIAYVLTWMTLLVGLSNILVIVDSRWLGFNDALISWAAIWASIFGQLFIYRTLSLIMKPNYLLRTLFTMIVVGLINFVLYLLVDERLGLSLNIATLMLGTLLMLFFLPFARGQGHIANFILGKIRVPFALLLVFVLVTSLAGLGQGSIYSLNYLQAAFVVLFNAYVLGLWLKIERRENANARSKFRAVSAVNHLLNKQLDEQITLFGMLFHEIKTPLTNLKFIIYKWVKKPEADQQIDHISHVLGQIEVMHKLEQGHSLIESVSVIDVVNELWAQRSNSATLRLQTKGDCHVIANPFLLDTLIKNVLDNAVKYSVDGYVQVLVYRAVDTCYLRVQNAVSVSHDLDVSKVTKKYWRATGNAGTRGTGLGLWLVQQLCEQGTIILDIGLRNGRFSVTLEVPCTHQ